MKLLLILTTLISSGVAFLPALFSLENYVKSSASFSNNNDRRLGHVCESLASFDCRHNVSALHGSWRQLLPKDDESTMYQTIDFSKRFALATTLYANGTRVEMVMPFEILGKGGGSSQKMYFTHAKQFTTYGDDSRFTKDNATCSAHSFELVYASTSLRVDRMMSNGAFRVLVPCSDVFLKLT